LKQKRPPEIKRIMLRKGVAVIGSTTIDKIVKDDSSVFRQGGVTTYSGLTYRNHDIPTIVVSNVAQKDDAVLDRLTERQIVVFSGRSDHTTHFVNKIAGEDRFQELHCKARPIQHGQIVNIIDNVDALHLGPLYPADIDSKIFTSIKKANIWIWLDVQGYTRKVIDKKIYPFVSKRLTAALMIADMVKANGSELQAILDFYHMNLEQLMHRFNIEEFVVTLGQDGGYVKTQSGKKLHYRAVKAKSVHDPTGAGDVFFAAYNICRFSKRSNIADACRYAAKIATRQVEGNYIVLERLSLT